MDQGVEERGQHHVDRRDRQHEGEEQRQARLAHDDRHAAGDELVRRGEADLAAVLFDAGGQFGLRRALGRVGGDRDLPGAVLAADPDRAFAEADVGDVGDRSQLTRGGADLDQVQLGGRVAILGQHLDSDVVAFAVLLEGPQFLSGEQGADRAADDRGRHSQVGRPIPIHVDLDLRLAGFPARADVDERRVEAHQPDQPLRVELQVFHPRATQAVGDGARSQLVVAARDPVDRRHGDLLGFRDSRQQLVTDPVHDRELAEVALALVRQLDVDRGAVGFLPAAAADRREAVSDLRIGREHFLGASSRFRGDAEGRADRHLQLDVELAPVLGDEQVERQGAGHQHAARRRHDGDGEGDHAMAERAPQHRLVEAIESVEAPAQDPAYRIPALAARQHPAAQHRREGQGEHARDADGDRHHHPELVEPLADGAGQECDRHEDGAEGEGGGDDGQRHLTGALLGSLAAPQALLDPPVDHLQDDDRVVDHDADRQRQRHQGHHVQREAGQVEERERRDDGGGDREGRDQGRPRVAQEQEDDGDHQQAAPEHVREHGVDRVLDEHRHVAGDQNLHAGRQIGPQGLDFRPNRFGDGHGVRPAAPPDLQRHPPLPVETGEGALLGQAVLDLRDVPEVDEAAAALGGDQGAEVLDPLHAARGGHGPLAFASLDAAAGRLGVLQQQGGADIVDRQAVAPEPHGVEPDPHLATARADDLDAADAGQSLEPVLDHVLRDLRQLADGERAAQHDGEDRRRVGIELDDHRILGVERQFGAHGSDLLAHLLRLDVHVVARLELDEDLGDPLRGDGAQFADALDRVDLLFEDVRDLGFDRLRGGSLEDRGDGDEGNLDVRVQVDVEPVQRHQAQDDQGQVQHECEHRPADRQQRQVQHGCLKGRSGARRGASSRLRRRAAIRRRRSARHRPVARSAGP